MHSYVTLLTNPDYLPGVQALARSLRLCAARWPLTVLALADVPGLDTLDALGCNVSIVAPLPVSAPFAARHNRAAQHAAAPFTKGAKPQFHNPLHNFIKLRVWELEQYAKVVFLDADTLVVRNIDRLFEYPEFVAAPNVYESLADFHRLNSGVFVAEPRRRTFDTLLGALDRPDVFWKRTDQTFLETVFPDWHGLPYTYNTLQYVWFNLPQLWDWQSIRVIHYQYEKPWEPDHAKRALLAPLIDVWRDVAERDRFPARLPAPPSAPHHAPP